LDLPRGGEVLVEAEALKRNGPAVAVVATAWLTGRSEGGATPFWLEKSPAR
jgi:hypothetical protein